MKEKITMEVMSEKEEQERWERTLWEMRENNCRDNKRERIMRRKREILKRNKRKSITKDRWERKEKKLKKWEKIIVDVIRAKEEWEERERKNSRDRWKIK